MNIITTWNQKKYGIIYHISDNSYGKKALIVMTLSQNMSNYHYDKYIMFDLSPQ